MTKDEARERTEKIVSEFQVREDQHPAADLFVWLRESSYPESLRCQDCGRHHQLDAVIPSEIWNKIASNVGLLCIDCIDARASQHGVTFEAEFYWTGKAGQSRLYEDSYGDQQARIQATPPADGDGAVVERVARALAALDHDGCFDDGGSEKKRAHWRREAERFEATLAAIAAKGV